jgi:predicted HTH transcriptional regulator
MSNSFTAPAETISREDVRAFLAEAQPENLNLEYKLELDDNHDQAVDSVAAMANSYGELPLLGVAEAGGMVRVRGRFRPR